MSVTVTARMGSVLNATVERDRPDEFWWVEWIEGMPLEPARISFRGNRPHGILEIGSDYEQELSEREVRLVEQVMPAGRTCVTNAEPTDAQVVAFGDAFYGDLTQWGNSERQRNGIADGVRRGLRAALAVGASGNSAGA
ncbi:hypothetical protein [Methylobacterium iners]|uniref:Uncharacterized protein n=1 Tax=Methylobacterium iners TaxID=418707 RepID=A0ABQ4S6D0_9HYPH|nr:hypothetical protein [Methylobacterium iners]GJD97439.1 hypothetical protein OCOJLMKI_4670 [Methylobacterium iners]